MLLRFYHTIKYFRYDQVYDLIRKRVLKLIVKVQDADLAPYEVEPWINFTHGETNISLTYTTQIVNLDRQLIFPDDWKRNTEPLLWQFHLHYLEDLKTGFAQINPEFYTNLILCWLKSNTDQSGVGWHPYTVSKRSINILKFTLNGVTLSDEILNLVTKQAHFIALNLERDIQANHLFTNLVALAFWEITTSLKIPSLNVVKKLNQEIEEQILDDGMHYERSPMYHNNFVLEVLDLINLLKTRQYLTEDYTNLLNKLLQIVPAMLEVSQLLNFNDQKIFCFNDTAVNSSIEPALLLEYAGKLGFEVERTQFEGLNILHCAGFLRAENNNFTAVINVGNVTCAYQPGHTHAESLSFELCDNSSVIFRNPGISTYENSKVRWFERSTIAHNTVSVDQRNSSDTWSSFRLGRRANTKLVKHEISSECFQVVANHDGFSKFCNKIIHTREIHMTKSTVVITDKVSGSWRQAESYFYLSPELEISQSGDGYLIATKDNLYYLSVEGGDILMENCMVSLDFNRKIAGKVIKTYFQSNIQKLILTRVQNENTTLC